MLDPKQVSEIVRDILKIMDVYTYADERLIKGTFALKSGLKRLYDKNSNGNYIYGLGMMKETDLNELYFETIRYSKFYKELISSATGQVFIYDKDEFNFVKEEMKYNVSMMIVMTYIFYNSRYKEVPDNRLAKIAETYQKFYDQSVNLDEFQHIYRSFFDD